MNTEKESVLRQVYPNGQVLSLGFFSKFVKIKVMNSDDPFLYMVLNGETLTLYQHVDYSLDDDSGIPVGPIYRCSLRGKKIHKSSELKKVKQLIQDLKYLKENDLVSDDFFHSIFILQKGLSAIEFDKFLNALHGKLKVDALHGKVQNKFRYDNNIENGILSLLTKKQLQDCLKKAYFDNFVWARLIPNSMVIVGFAVYFLVFIISALLQVEATFTLGALIVLGSLGGMALACKGMVMLKVVHNIAPTLAIIKRSGKVEIEMCKLSPLAASENFHSTSSISPVDNHNQKSQDQNPKSTSSNSSISPVDNHN